MADLPARAPRISQEKQAEILRLSIRQVSKAEIARRLAVDRHTVARVLRRTTSALQVANSVNRERMEALSVYREIQRTAWEKVESGIWAPAQLLAEIRQAQQRIDALLGLPEVTPEQITVESFQQEVIEMIQAESPDLRQRIERRLRERVHGIRSTTRYTLEFDRREDDEPQRAHILPAKPATE